MHHLPNPSPGNHPIHPGRFLIYSVVIVRRSTTGVVHSKQSQNQSNARGPSRTGLATVRREKRRAYRIGEPSRVEDVYGTFQG
ncbi:uncharacterized protein EI90DRAFT_926129 [Cantharellus anzutake]|uniref:uncharacterized protein n=1 Tax=Cantharellus anzutake TaxID=1750568 RepID=UPI001903D93C|nr:uncharacterized protein EI90DRAFT_926129 [Cantharellus anzutake]KAF8332114.1 hypothetical protein EI90DRAFT_926129 [Cantharellus anzutake]